MYAGALAHDPSPLLCTWTHTTLPSSFSKCSRNFSTSLLMTSSMLDLPKPNSRSVVIMKRCFDVNNGLIDVSACSNGFCKMQSILINGGKTLANLFMPFSAGVVDDTLVEVVAPQVSDVLLQRLVFAPTVGLFPSEGLTYHLMRALAEGK